MREQVKMYQLVAGRWPLLCKGKVKLGLYDRYRYRCSEQLSLQIWGFNHRLQLSFPLSKFTFSLLIMCLCHGSGGSCPAGSNPSEVRNGRGEDCCDKECISYQIYLLHLKLCLFSVYFPFMNSTKDGCLHKLNYSVSKQIVCLKLKL